MRLLIVDDDEVDRLAVIRALTNAGLQGEFREACTVEDARRLIDEERPDCVLLDFCMPGQDGVSFLETLSFDSPEGEIDYPIILLTGLGDERLAVRALRAGAVDYVPKDEVGTRTLPNAVFRAVHQAEDISRLRARRRRNAEWALRERRRRRSATEVWSESICDIERGLTNLRKIVEECVENPLEVHAAVGRLEALTDEAKSHYEALTRRRHPALIDTRRLLVEVAENLDQEGILDATHVSFGVLPSVTADTDVLRRTFHDLLRRAAASGLPQIQVEASRGCGGWCFSLICDPMSVPHSGPDRRNGSHPKPKISALRALLSTVGGDLRHRNGHGQSVTSIFLPDPVRPTK